MGLSSAISFCVGARRDADVSLFRVMCIMVMDDPVLKVVPGTGWCMDTVIEPPGPAASSAAGPGLAPEGNR